MKKLGKIEQSLALKGKEVSGVRHTVTELQQELRQKQSQLEWLKKQLFGRRSENQRCIDEMQKILIC